MLKPNKNLRIGILMILVISILSLNSHADLYLNSKTGYINLNTTGQTRMQITPGGNLDLLGIANVSIPGNFSVGGNVSVDNSTLFVDSQDNRVGIGTNSPSRILHVKAGAGVIRTQSTTSGNNVGMEMYNSTGSEIGGVFSAEDTANMRFITAGVEKMTILKGGNVGIGTTNPGANFDIVNDLRLTSTAGTADISANQTIGSLEFYYNDDSATAPIVGAKIVASTPTAWSGANANFNSDLRFYTTTNLATAATEKMRIDQDGDVGIGTTEPARGPLHIHQASGGQPADLHLTAADIGSASTDGVTISADEDGHAAFWLRENSYMNFATNGTERMRIDNNGNVGIGTTVPDGVLDLGSATGGRALSWGGTSNNYANIFTPYSNSGIVLATGFQGNTSADSYLSSYGSVMRRSGIRLNAFNDNGIQFFTDGSATVADGSAFTPTERMRIDTNGKVGIGTTSPGNELDVTGTGDNPTVYIETNSTQNVDATNAYGDSIRIRNVNTGTNIASGISIRDGSSNQFGAGIFFIQTGQSSGAETWETAFWTSDSGNSGAGERMRIDDVGNVGIGTIVPGGKLAVEDSAGSSSAPHLLLNASGGTSASANIRLDADRPSDTNEAALIAIHNNGATPIAAFQFDRGSTDLKGDIIFRTSNSEQMRVDEDGNVGIGTTAPSQLLTLSKAGNNVRYLTIISPASGGIDKAIQFGTRDDNGWNASFIDSTNAADSSAKPLYINPSSAQTWFGAGNVGIGTTNPEQTLHVNRSSDGVAIRTQDSDNFKCDINPGSGADWSCASDARKKENILELEPSLNKILNLKPRRFDTIYGKKNLSGFIAQEVLKVLPETVDTTDPNEFSLAQGEFMPHVIKAMQELKAEKDNEIDKLKRQHLESKQKIQFQNSEINELKLRLLELESKFDEAGEK
jgi:hypothetical protein